MKKRYISLLKQPFSKRNRWLVLWWLLPVFMGGCSRTPSQSPASPQSLSHDEQVAKKQEQKEQLLPALPRKSPQPTPVPLSRPRKTRSQNLEYRMYPQTGHLGQINSVSLTGSGDWLLTGSKDKTVRFWDVKTGKLLRIFSADGEVRSVQFSKDSTQAIAGDSLGRLKVWDVQSGESVKDLDTGRGPITFLKVFSDNRRVVTSHEGNGLYLWDIKKGKLIHAFGGDGRHTNSRVSHEVIEAISAAIAPDQNFVVGGYKNGAIKLWNVQTGKMVRKFKAHSGEISALALNFNGKQLISNSNDGLKLWDLDQQSLLRHHPDVGSSRFMVLDGMEKAIWMANHSSIVYVSLEKGTILRRLGNADYAQHYAIDSGRGGLHIAAGNREGDIEIWDITKPIPAHTIKKNNETVVDFSVSKNDFKIAGASVDGNLYIWDVNQVALTSSLHKPKTKPIAVIFSPSGQHLLSVHQPGNDNVLLWDVHVGKLVRAFDTGDSVFNPGSVVFTPDGSHFVLGDHNGKITVFNTRDGKVKETFEVPKSVDALTVTGDGKHLLIVTGASLHVRDLMADKTTKKIALNEDSVSRIATSFDVRFAAIAARQGVLLVDLSQEVVVHRFGSTQHNYATVAFSPDGKYIAAGGTSRAIDVFEIESLKHVAAYQGHLNALTCVDWSSSGSHLISSGKDGTTKVWNVATGAVVTMVSRKGEWLAYTDDGYFDASRRGGMLAAAVTRMEGYSIEQLAVRNNRPDILLQRIEVGAKERQHHFEALYQKRLKKLGIREENLVSAFQLAPKISIAYLDKNDKIVEFAFSIDDFRNELTSYNIFVNDVPLYGSNGKPTSGKGQYIRAKIELTSGINKIEASALNSVGVESMRVGQHVSFQPKVQSNLYYLGFGVSDYDDPALELKYAAKDAKDLEKVFQSARGFNHVHTRTYLDGAVTVDTIFEAKQFLSKAKVDDVVVLFVAGHGLYGGNDSSDYYFLTHDTDLNRLSETAANFEAIENLLQGIPPRRKLFLLDTCQSGELDNEMKPAFLTNAAQRGLQARGIRKKKRTGLYGDYRRLETDRNRYIYNDLFRRSGAIVLSSSRGSEWSFERDEFENGVFTEIVLRALTSRGADTDRDGLISTDELRAYVIRRVPEVTSGLQHPVVDRDNLYTSFSFPKMSPF